KNNTRCFFFQAEDGIRDRNVTGVQTCALPICKLESIRFVDSLEGCSKGIFITFEQGIGVRFLFFKGRIKTRDVYTASHELHLHRDEAYFIAVDFPDKTSNLLYQSVMEANEKEKENMAQIADNILEKLLMEK